MNDDWNGTKKRQKPMKKENEKYEKVLRKKKRSDLLKSVHI